MASYSMYKLSDVIVDLYTKVYQAFIYLHFVFIRFYFFYIIINIFVGHAVGQQSFDVNILF